MISNNPKISIITVCYNAVDSIKKTILSVLDQTYQNIEYIVIDGHSTDGTLDVINRYRDRISYFVSEPDKGIYDAMNKGIKAATGDWINFMNAGDTFYDSSVLSKIVENIEDDSDVLFGDVAYELDNILYREKATPFYEHLPLHHSMGFNHQSSFIRTQLAKELGFDLKYKLAADYNMIITIYRKNGVFQQLHDTIVAIYDTKGLSAEHYRQHIYETLMVDHPVHFQNKIVSYLFAFRNQLEKPIKNTIKKFCPGYVLKRRLQYFEKI